MVFVGPEQSVAGAIDGNSAGVIAEVKARSVLTEVFKYTEVGGAVNGNLTLLGMDTAAVLFGYGSREELEGCAPTALCASPADLLEFIKNS